MATYGTGTEQPTSDSCMNGHSATSVDSSYVWLNAMTSPLPLEP